MLRELLSGLLYLAGVVLAILGVFLLFFLYITGAFNKDYTVTELIESYEENQQEILELKSYFNSITPENTIVGIELNNINIIDRLSIYIKDSCNTENTIFSFEDWDLNVNATETNNIIKNIGWNIQTLKTIKNRLDKANCISVNNLESADIGFKRSGMGMYHFMVFDKPITGNKITEYNDSCYYIYANENLVLSYGAGVLGSQCFYNF